jgi:DNA-binding transcriptional regulator LsrR (DeoR family)
MTRPADLAALVKVSRLYYELGETQEAIAAMLGIPRPQVSRLLKRARAEGVVEIRVVDRTERSSTVADELVKRHGLRAVHLAPTFAGSDELTRRRVGRLAAQVLLGAVRDGMTVGVGEGAAMAALADGLDEVASPIAATVVPLSGGFWGALGGREPFRRIADALGATAHGLLAPGVLDDEATRDALCRHAGIRAVTELWAHLDVAVFGIGGPTWSEGGIGSEVVRELEGHRAVGEMLIAPFDIDGAFVGDVLRRRTITFDARELHQVATTIGIAAGAAKVAPILGALRSGGVRILVTDAETASAVLKLATPNPANGSRHPAGVTA